MGFEPTPLRTGAWSQRLRPLGQTVNELNARSGKAHAQPHVVHLVAASGFETKPVHTTDRSWRLDRSANLARTCPLLSMSRLLQLFYMSFKRCGAPSKDSSPMSRMTLRDTKNAGITSDWVRTEHAHWRVCVCGKNQSTRILEHLLFTRDTHRQPQGEEPCALPTKLSGPLTQ